MNSRTPVRGCPERRRTALVQMLRCEPCTIWSQGFKPRRTRRCTISIDCAPALSNTDPAGRKMLPALCRPTCPARAYSFRCAALASCAYATRRIASGRCRGHGDIGHRGHQASSRKQHDEQRPSRWRRRGAAGYPAISSCVLARIDVVVRARGTFAHLLRAGLVQRACNITALAGGLAARSL